MIFLQYILLHECLVCVIYLLVADRQSNTAFTPIYSRIIVDYCYNDNTTVRNTDGIQTK